MVAHAYDRVRRNAEMPGVILVPQSVRLGWAVEELEIILSCGEPRDFRNIVFHL